MQRAVFACWLLAAIAGCGGEGGGGGGATLQQQHQQALKLGDARSRAIRLIQIAYRRNEAGDLQGAHDSIAAAGEAARLIEDKNEKAETLASVAYAAGAVHWSTEANKLVKEVRAAIEQAPNPGVAAAALAKLSVVYGKHLQNPAAADAYLKQSEEIAGKIESPEGRATALLAIAGRFHELEKADEAQRVADAAIALARSVEDPRRRSETLAEAAVRLQKMGQSEPANQTFDEAEAAADDLGDNAVSRAYALLNLAQQLQTAGQKTRAGQTLKKAEDLIYQVQDQGEKEPLLARLQKQRNQLP